MCTRLCGSRLSCSSPGVAVVSMRSADRKLVAEFPGIRRAPRYSAASPAAVRAAARDARAGVLIFRSPSPDVVSTLPMLQRLCCRL